MASANQLSEGVRASSEHLLQVDDAYPMVNSDDETSNIANGKLNPDQDLSSPRSDDGGFCRSTAVPSKVNSCLKFMSINNF